jgi:hypothetical protein
MDAALRIRLATASDVDALARMRHRLWPEGMVS